MEKTHEKDNTWRDWLSFQNIVGFLLIIVNLSTFVFYNYKYTNILTSDMSSELVLSELLAGEKGIFSERWRYSTELRVFNTQIIMKLLFHFFKDWSLVRATGNVILQLMVYLGIIFMLIQMKISRDRLLLPTALVLLPFSDYQCIMLLVGGFYIPHIFFAFAILGCMFRLVYRKATVIRQILLGGGYFTLFPLPQD